MENEFLDAFRLNKDSLKESDKGRELYWRYSWAIYNTEPEMKVKLVDWDDGGIKVLTEDSTSPSPTNYDNCTFADEEDKYKQYLIKEKENLKNNINMSNKDNSLRGLTERTVVHCKTEQEAQKVLTIANKAGLTWINGKKFSPENTQWERRGAESCYELNRGIVHVVAFWRAEGYTILSAEDFIKKNSQPKIPNVQLTPEQFQFNLDRLASETDVVVKKQLDIAKGEFKVEVASVNDEVIAELKGKVALIKDEVADKFTTEVGVILSNTKDLLLDELRKGRTTINVGIGDIANTYSISNDDHYMMETVFKSLLLHKKIMLAGEAGTGKTYMAAQMASKLGLRFFKYSCSRDSSVHDLLGYKQPRSETYLTTTFLEAYEKGGVFLVDEYSSILI